MQLKILCDINLIYKIVLVDYVMQLYISSVN